MNPCIRYEDYAKLEHPDKVDFVDGFISNEHYRRYTPKEAKTFLNNVFTCEQNSYLKQQAIYNYNLLVLLGVLNPNSLIGFLIEDIADDEDVYIQVERLRLLFLHFDNSPSIEDTFDRLSRHNNAEVASEAYFRRGLLFFLNAAANSDTRLIDLLQKCIHYFQMSDLICENRVDARYYNTVASLLLAIIGNEPDQFRLLLAKTLEHLWNLKVFSFSGSAFEIESKISFSLGVALNIINNVHSEPVWTNFKRELKEIFWLHQQLIAIEACHNSIQDEHFRTFRDNLQTSFILPIYKFNLTAAEARIRGLIQSEPDGSEFRDFLKEIQHSISAQSDKKKDQTVLVAMLARKFKGISVDQILRDVDSLVHTSAQELAALIISYSDATTDGFYTGFPTGDEIWKLLRAEIYEMIPDYPASKWKDFGIVLADVIRYLIRTMQEKKEFFPELYDSTLVSGRTEHIFQENLYRNLRQSRVAHHYSYEPNKAGGGRIDIAFNNSNTTYPIEVKKTPTLPSWDSIIKDYLAQAVTYTNTYDRLGIFLVYDLSEKKGTTSPINDVRELFKLQSLKGLYQIDGNYPDYIVSVIVPANKVSPSSMSRYR